MSFLSTKDTLEDARCLIGRIADDTLFVEHAVRPRMDARTLTSVTYRCRESSIGTAHTHIMYGQYFHPGPSVVDVLNFYGQSYAILHLVVSEIPRGALIVFTLRDGRSGYTEWSR